MSGGDYSWPWEQKGGGGGGGGGCHNGSFADALLEETVCNLRDFAYSEATEARVATIEIARDTECLDERLAKLECRWPRYLRTDKEYSIRQGCDNLHGYP